MVVTVPQPYPSGSRGPRDASVRVVPTWLGFAWTSPNTLLGLLLGVFTFQLPRLEEGLIVFAASRG